MDFPAAAIEWQMEDDEVAKRLRLSQANQLATSKELSQRWRVFSRH